MEAARDLLITNARIVTWGSPNRILADHGLLISKGRIAEIGPSSRLSPNDPSLPTLDARGQIVMPGNICAHTHFYGAFARGMGIPGMAPTGFPEILRKLWWPLDKSLAAEDIRTSALVCLVDAIRHGTTTLIDHHASPNFIDGCLDILAEAVEQSGVRGILCYEVSDRDGRAKAKAGIKENLRLIERCNSGAVAGGRLAAMLGLHASLTLSDRTLDECRKAAPGGAGFHIHLAEHQADQDDSLKKSGLRVTDRLHKHGILGPASLVAHAVHVDDREIDLLAETGTWVSHQPRSNMNNGVGVAEIESMMRAGVRVCMGNDGFSNSMWEEWKAAYLVHKVWHRDPRRMPGGTVIEIAVNNNAALVSSLFRDTPIGLIAPDAQADLMVVDYDPPTPLNPENLASHILFGFRESMVTGTIVAGTVLMWDRVLKTLDEGAIAARSRELAPKIWQRYRGFVPKD